MKTLRQLHTEEDDEQRFQEDLKKAVRESLGMCSVLDFLSIPPLSLEACIK